jgi:predicted fused transcriptional regulator/phosphomethylpyrimidine kinase
MVQIISKYGKVLCVTTVPYPKEIIKQMKQSGYKVTEKEQGK